MIGDTLDDWMDEDDDAEIIEQIKVLEARKGKDADGARVWSTEEDGSAPVVVLPDEWEEGLIRDAKGHALFNHYNVSHTLRCCPEWDGFIAYNEFTGRKMLMKPIPGSRTPKCSFRVRELADHDILTATAWFNKNRFPRAYKSVVADAVDEVVQEYRYNPLRDYLEAAAAGWDNVPRVRSWLMTYCGAVPADPMEQQYVEEVGLKWMVSAVARAMQPGCKADGVLILEGAQGAFKSTAAKILAGPEFFGDNLPQMHTREASSYVRGRWIIELAELANVSKAEVEIVKAFISRTEERFRPAYGRNEVSYPRQCVFMGSTNRTDYLRDDTGNRRFWPVQVGRVDVKALEADRDQLWGEAVALYRAGETWWLSAAVERIAAQEQGDRMLEDPWTSNVLAIVEDKTEVCVPQILTDMLIEVGRKDRMMSNRVQSILMQNGWFRSGRMTSGTYNGQNRFIKKRDAKQQAEQQQAAEVKAAEDVASGLGDMDKDVF